MGIVPSGTSVLVRTADNTEIESVGYKSVEGTNGAPLRYVRPHHKSMARMFAAGMTPTEIAQVTGFTPGQLSRIQGSPLFQAEVYRLQSRLEDDLVDHQRDLLTMATTALEKIDEDLNLEVGENLQARKIRQAAAFDVLDRVLPKRTEGTRLPTIKATQININDASPQQLERMISGFLGNEG